MRRDVIERIGGLFDERFHPGNDVDLCRVSAGLTVDLMQEFHVVHLGSASLSRVRPRRTATAGAGAAFNDYYAIHEPYWRRVALRRLTPRRFRNQTDRRPLP